MVFKVFKRTFSSTSQTTSKDDFWRLKVFIILRSSTSIILQNIRVSTRFITHVIMRYRFFVWRWRRSLCHYAVISLHMNSLISKMLLLSMIQSTIIYGYMLITTATSTKVTNMFRVESSLHRT